MKKVYCACIECKYNKNNVCRTKTINLSAGNIATVHQGRKNVWECGNFEMSEEAKEIKKAIERLSWFLK